MTVTAGLTGSFGNDRRGLPATWDHVVRGSTDKFVTMTNGIPEDSRQADDMRNFSADPTMTADLPKKFRQILL
jgi:hypothetical protein